ncbi:MAG: 16S rRNA (guanine(527)-N(7))-methyltransferase RsmG [Synergistaceae bacterium]|jgi:16S rRNA (guanine527-N7)-methyltransferase|nr:16S rRNA (guanine(527)-N(7))-methyltransferase RsmG [Synergistaceae bacterium]
MNGPSEDTLREGKRELEKLWEPKLRRYAELLAACVTARLTGSREAGEIYDVHVTDSLWSVPLLPEGGGVIDVGSGGGLPGMVWAMCRPDLSVTLLDSVRKKCRATEEIAAALGLSNVSVVWARCEDYARSARERAVFAGARALASAPVLAEYLSPLVAPGGRLLAFKGPKGAEELEAAGDKWGLLGLSRPQILPYGPEDRSYSFILWDKIAPLSPSWPRKAGLALSKSWWR